MIRKILAGGFMLLITNVVSADHLPFDALIIVPVVDLTIDPPKLYKKELRQYPISPTQAQQCHRAHQGLFNETVRCIARSGSYLQIQYPHLVYGFDAQGRALNTFWIHEHAVRPFRLLKRAEVLHTVPSSEYTDRHLVLIYPWKQFSLGTRFVRTPHLDTPETYGVVYYDAHHHHILEATVPRHLCFIETPEIDAKKLRRKLTQFFNSLLTTLQENNLFIPYVWGGSSFIVDETLGAPYKTPLGWHRPHHGTHYKGFDCSELIWRSSRICGIPVVAKTTGVYMQQHKELTKDEMPEWGDMLWFPGHVMLITPGPSNTIIHARGYQDGGTGLVERIPLGSYFRNITSYAELTAAYRASKPLIRMTDAADKVVSEWKILKLI